MKKMLLALIALFVLCGSTTFETVLNIEKGESSREQIRSMLGEPAKKLFENDQEVWQYHLNEKENRCIECLYCFFCLPPNRAIEFKGELEFMADQLRQYDEVTRKVT